MTKITFDIRHAGEPAAGFGAYTETVTVEVESGVPDHYFAEFVNCIHRALDEWFCGAKITRRPQ